MIKMLRKAINRIFCFAFEIPEVKKMQISLRFKFLYGKTKLERDLQII